MEITSNELINAVNVPSSITAADTRTITEQQIKDMLLSYLAQKDYTLPKFFERSHAMTSPAASFGDVVTSLHTSLRGYLMDVAVKNSDTYTNHALIINKIFENIKNLVEILAVNKITYDRNELVVTLLGNLLKSLI